MDKHGFINRWANLHTCKQMVIDFDEYTKSELTNFLDFLLKNGYCDSDVYSEPPSAIDRYMHPELNQ